METEHDLLKAARELIAHLIGAKDAGVSRGFREGTKEHGWYVHGEWAGTSTDDVLVALAKRADTKGANQ